MIRVLWAVNSFGVGGAERQIANMANYLNDSDFQIDVVYYSNKDVRMIDTSNVRFNRIFIDKDRIGRLQCLLEIRKLIMKNNYDIAHAFGGGTANIYMRYAAFFTGTKIVIGAMLGKKHFEGSINKLINSLANLRSNFWTVNNIDLKPLLMRDLKFANENSVFLLNNGFPDRDHIDYQENHVTYYDTLKGDSKVFIFVGRLAKVKNIDLFIDAALDIIANHDDVDFWIIGDGPMHESLSNIIKVNNAENRIKLLGYRSDVDVALSRADCFVLTSFSEGSPNAMAEAMRAQKPLISTKCTSLDKFIIENINGLSVDINNKQQLVCAMKSVLQKSDSELREMGEVSYRLFKINFEIKTVAEDFRALYSTLLGGR